MLLLLGLWLLAAAASVGDCYRYPTYQPVHPPYPSPLQPPGPPAPAPAPPPGLFPLRDQSHAHPSLLPPPPEPGAGPPPPPPEHLLGSASRPTLPHRPPQWTSLLGQQRPMDEMVDITNELGVAVLQDYAYSRGNFAFSPYGVASVLVVLFEGARGETARQLHTTLKLPWDRDVLRVGFRDVHRNLRSYFSHEGYLSGVSLSQSRSALLPEFRRVLRFYGYDVDLPPEGFNYTDSPVILTSEQITSHKPMGNGTMASNTTTNAGDGAPPKATDETSTGPSTTKAALEDTQTAGSSSSSPTSTQTPAPASEATLTTSEATPSSESSPIAEATTPPNEPTASSSEATPPSETTLSAEGSPASEETSPTALPAADLGGTADADNEVEEQDAERLNPDATLSLLSPSLVQQKFPGFLMGSRLQEQLNSLFPDGLPEGAPESRADDADLPQPPTTTDPAPTVTTTSSSVTTTYQPIETTTVAAPVADEVEADPDPEPESTERPPETTTQWLSETWPWTATSLLAVEATAATDTPGPSETTTTTSSEETTEAVTDMGATSTVASQQTTTRTMAVPEGGVTSTADPPSPVPVATPIPAAVLGRRARVPGPALSFWTGLEAASAHNASKIRARRALKGSFPDLSLQLQNGMFDSHVATGDELFTQLPRRPFLVDGAFEEPVPVMEYTSSFPFAYIPRLHALALEFPLDDQRYRLLLLLPVERQGLRQLLHGLSRVPLREIQRALRPTRVHAVVPAFMVEGFVILTPTLQQLGIWDMFDPRRADLSGMTDDPELYVRNIEQAVTVVIKNYVEILDIQTRTTAARSRLDQFIATHPFLYFVMDSETQVSLMAGKVVDPLNSRIY